MTNHIGSDFRLSDYYPHGIVYAGELQGLPPYVEISCSTVRGLIIDELENLTEEAQECLRKIEYLLGKYNSYQENYLNPGRSGFRNRADGNPLLYDALCTATQFAYATEAEYTEAVEEDIEEIVQLYPESLRWNQSVIEDRERVTPLFMACANSKVPVSIVDLLLKHGANPDEKIKMGPKFVSIFTALHKVRGCQLFTGIPVTRLNEIDKLFKKYREKARV